MGKMAEQYKGGYMGDVEKTFSIETITVIDSLSRVRSSLNGETTPTYTIAYDQKGMDGNFSTALSIQIQRGKFTPEVSNIHAELAAAIEAGLAPEVAFKNLQTQYNRVR